MSSTFWDTYHTTYDRYTNHYTVITRNINNVEVKWIVKIQAASKYIYQVSPETRFSIWVKEVGSNYGTEPLGEWKYKIYTYRGSDVEVDISDTITLQSYEAINSDEYTLIGGGLVRDANISAAYFSLECPKNSVFDAYGKESNVWLKDVYSASNAPKMSLISDLLNKGFKPSTISASNCNIGDNITFYTSIKSNVESSFFAPENYSDFHFHHLVCSYDNKKWYTVGTVYHSEGYIYWDIPLEFYKAIPNERQGTLYFNLSTYILCDDGDLHLIGETETTSTMYAVEADCKPTCSPTIYDTNNDTVALTGDSSKLIRYKSNAYYKANAEAKNYATITSIEVSNGSTTLNGATGTFNAFTNDYFVFKITDSRGYSTSVKYTPTIIPFVNLSCIIDAKSPTADGILSFSVSGNYWNGNFGASQNSLVVYYRIKQVKQSTGTGSFSYWRELNYQLSNNKYTAMETLGGVDYRDTYVIEAYAIDIFGRVDAEQEAVSTLPVFDWGINDFNMNVDMAIYGTLTVNGDIECTGTINGSQGTGGSSYDTHYGTCLTDGSTSAKLVTCPTFTTLDSGSSIRVKFNHANLASSVSINVNNTGVYNVRKHDADNRMSNAWVDGEVKDFVFDGEYWIMVDGSNINHKIEYGTWTPKCTNYIESNQYYTQDGWYQKVGNVVTVGFDVMFINEDSASTGNMVQIFNLPYTASSFASGGGIVIHGDSEGLSYITSTSGVSWFLSKYSNFITGTAYYQNDTDGEYMRLTGTICYTTND